ncbi:hypothetical protein OU798_02170 [Prolixibacteraceae bacterium Z1-6]|uniref:Uncharacterized protein n=1 Tax=Draconibacterium aestuarii TaxID=2998507 RepID=A0A9X3J600_9BACT|nr:hypothetical protein [Prolixibacteraceae bacterium Z1-6]
MTKKKFNRKQADKYYRETLEMMNRAREMEEKEKWYNQPWPEEPLHPSSSSGTK